MSRTSRIPHPPGSRFVSLHHWAVRRFGIAGAAVLGLLDFFDRAHGTPGEPLASRQRIIADLEGIVGKHLVDRALQDLVTAGVIHRNEETTMGRRNWETRVEYSLDITGLQQLLATPETGSSGEFQNRDFRGLPKTGPDSGPIPGVPYKRLEVEEDVKKEAAALGMAAHHPANAAAATMGRQDQNRRRRGDETVQYGVEIWTMADAEGLQALVDQHSAERVEDVAGRLTPAAGHRAPYLSVVVAAFQKLEKAEVDMASAAAQQKQLQEQAARERAASARTATAHTYFQSLDEPMRAALLDTFAEHLSLENKAAFQFYRRSGLRSKTVESEFAKFILSNHISRSGSAVA